MIYYSLFLWIHTDCFHGPRVGDNCWEDVAVERNIFFYPFYIFPRQNYFKFRCQLQREISLFLLQTFSFLVQSFPKLADIHLNKKSFCSVFIIYFLTLNNQSGFNNSIWLIILYEDLNHSHILYLKNLIWRSIHNQNKIIGYSWSWIESVLCYAIN